MSRPTLVPSAAPSPVRYVWHWPLIGAVLVCGAFWFGVGALIVWLT